MNIIYYQSNHQKDFERLNKNWLNKYFAIEPLDELLLSQPEEHILKNGGYILFVEHQGQLIGTVALIVVKQDVYELAKMVVDERFQGLGAGKLLCSAAIEKATELHADKLILFTNSKLQAAINIYHKFGFKDVSLEGKQYTRAEIKMELMLKNDTEPKWFDRKFDFNFWVEQYDHLLGRLPRTPFVFNQMLSLIPEDVQVLKPNGKWSIKENVGHLIVLEPLWQLRFEDIKKGKNELSPADLDNRLTNEMNFNQSLLQGLLKSFS